MNTTTYELMARVGMGFRNLRMPPEDMIAEAALEPGWRVLDYGCGPGTFTVLAGKAVGTKGEVFALDIEPVALQVAGKRVDRSGLDNVLVLPGCEAELIKSNSLDMVILFDVYHLLDDPLGTMKDIHRMLKPAGRLCFSDHHMDEELTRNILTRDGLFRLRDSGRYTSTFDCVK
jgi:ubiquinone/menaquinone biosynthesis C-methylase UbiE